MRHGVNRLVTFARDRAHRIHDDWFVRKQCIFRMALVTAFGSAHDHGLLLRQAWMGVDSLTGNEDSEETVSPFCHNH